MTDREKAIVMAYTGVCMLSGDKFQIFHKYAEDIMGRPIWTHEMGLLADEIKGKSKADFMALCAEEPKTVSIPEGATNGDAFKIMFNKTFLNTIIVHQNDKSRLTIDLMFTREWWEMPYRRSEWMI